MDQNPNFQTGIETMGQSRADTISEKNRSGILKVSIEKDIQ